LQCIPTNQPYTKKGKSFTQFCQEKQAQGISIEPKCLSTIVSCDQMDVCTHTSTGASK
jgi:DNA transposition AAA+ family ATPase